MGLEILLFVPNLIGYLRMSLLVGSWFTHYSYPLCSAILYSIQLSLDAVDGYSARKLNQISAFGAWFDVVIDVLGRGMLWSRLYHFGYLVVALEWLVFTTTHAKGANWKSSFVHVPWFVEGVMAKNFKTPMGSAAIGGLHILPLWLYCHYTEVLSDLFVPLSVQYVGIVLLAAGRALCAAVEIWCIYSHIVYLCSDEANHPISKHDTSTAD